MILYVLFFFEMASVYSGCRIRKNKADCSNLNLTSVPQNLSQNISVLDLSGNKLRQLTNKSFEKYTKLHHLILDDNDLTYFEEDAFYGLKELTKLSVNANKLDFHTSYPKSVFRPLSNLIKLYMMNNVYSSPNPMDATYYPYFGHLTNLEILHLDLVSCPVFNESGLIMAEKLTEVIFTNCALLSMKNNSLLGISNSVKYVSFRNCEHITEVESNFLAVFPNLQDIELYHTDIHLSQALSLLYPFQNKSMKSIEFYRVSAEFTDTEKFPYAVKVTKGMMEYLQTICVENLVLFQTGIVDFEPGSLLTYNHPECFKKIVFTGNRFSVAIGTKNVEFLELLLKLTNLEVFDFSYIPLKFVNISTIDHDRSHSNFESNLLRKNREFEAKTSVNKHNSENVNSTSRLFSVPPKLQTLRLSHYLDRLIFRQDLIFRHVSKLRHLDVSYLQIGSIPNIMFDGTNNLEYLDASGIDSTLYCQKATIPLFHNASSVLLQNSNINFALVRNSSFFRLFPKVINFYLSSNNLWSLHNNVFKSNMHIKNLNLIRNHFLEIPKAITSLPDLEVLDMTYNYLQTINESMRNWFDRQQRTKQKFLLKLFGNPLKCTCHTSGFIKWLFITKVKFRKSPNFVCRLENGTLTYTKDVYDNFHELFKDCYSEIWLRIGIGILVVFVVLVIPTAILFNFRWQIAYLIYRRFKRVIEKNIKEKFKYDMYVCYAEESACWIKDILVPKIENTWKMSLCIADRDFLLGEMKSDTIADAISQCRHVLIILSRRFQEGKWTSYELDRIKYEKYSHKLQKIIIISRDGSVENVPIELDNIWNDAYVLNWSDVDKESGWDKLRLNLFSEVL